ncbi:molybdopterin cofactor-binding domain-containing protein [Thalassotalea sp. PLHSN55]|uniref:xanthine dehydrogenase family protein molybdopterin-binding subunit n=1 Tax=Thalassotalea sp. PLHSN55 TaxID=3435888 RepID=UPI003F847E33
MMKTQVLASIENISRRSFLKGLGIASGSFVLASTLPVGNLAKAHTSKDLNELNIFISIHENNHIDIICHRSEMGQGVRTSIPQLIADELEADWSLVNVVQGMANNAYGSQNTDGSSSIRKAFFQLRQMGASARYMLREAAANFWKVPVDECIAKNHQVSHAKSGKNLSYGQLAELASTMTPPSLDTLVLKDKSEFNYIGKRLANVDLPDIVNGTTTFGQDVQLPNMLIASINRCPVVGGKVKAFDASLAKKVKGVKQVIEIELTPGAAHFNPLAGVAVLATNTFSAIKGREQLDISWDFGKNQAHQSDEYLAERQSLVQQPGKTCRNEGNIEKAFEQHKKQISAVYTVPYLSHAPMEPPAATAMFHEDGRCELWACTQSPQRARDAVAKALGLEKDQVLINVTLLGGAFGRKAKADYLVEAAVLAKAAGQPVKVVWSREDDIQNGYYHAISAQYYQGALDDKNQVQAWLARTSFPPIASTFNKKKQSQGQFELAGGFADVPFNVENLRCESIDAPAHLRIGWLRSVANIHHGFALSSFVDELAATAGQDAKGFWFNLLGDNKNFPLKSGGFKNGNYGAKAKDHPINTDRYKAVIEEACQLAGWGKKMPKGEGLGLAVHRSFLAYVAVVSHVKVVNNHLQVKKMYCAADAGQIVNLDRVEAQMEGAMIFGMSIALLNNISVKDGQVEQSNFHDYPMTRMSQAPDIAVKIIESDGLPGGVGEPGVPPVMASITNAIFAATGKRIRDLPLNKQFSV